MTTPVEQLASVATHVALDGNGRAEAALRSLELLGSEAGIQSFRCADGRVEVVVLDERGDGKFSAFGVDLYDAICQAATILGIEREEGSDVATPMRCDECIK